LFSVIVKNEATTDGSGFDIEKIDSTRSIDNCLIKKEQGFDWIVIYWRIFFGLLSFRKSKRNESSCCSLRKSRMSITKHR